MPYLRVWQRPPWRGVVRAATGQGGRVAAAGQPIRRPRLSRLPAHGHARAQLLPPCLRAVPLPAACSEVWPSSSEEGG